jgi:CubicO group peptidase (beta-lactamase class C family)
MLFTKALSLMSQEKAAARIDSLFTAITNAGDPGGAVLVAIGDKVIFSKGYGIEDIHTKKPITVNSIFNTGSVSKTFVSNAILVLEQRKQLSLDDPLSKYFPGFKNKEIADKVKIRHLLSHVSGLPDNRQVDKDPVFYLTADDAQNFAPIQQTDTLVFEPGERYQYSNPAFNGLALIIEKITGGKWQDFVRKEIFARAGMTESDITDGAHPETGVVHAYSKVKGKFKELDYGEEPTFCAAGNGGIWCSVSDLHKYYLALNKASFLNQEILANSMEVKTFTNWKSDKAPANGYSWFITSSANGLRRVGHTGSQGGFRADFEMVPEKNLLVCMLFNTPYAVSYLTKEIEKILAEEKIL